MLYWDDNIVFAAFPEAQMRQSIVLLIQSLFISIIRRCKPNFIGNIQRYVLSYSFNYSPCSVQGSNGENKGCKQYEKHRPIKDAALF